MNQPQSPPPELPGLRFIRKVGAGGYADVYLYEQMHPTREVAVKVLKSRTADSEAYKRFRDEIRVLQSPDIGGWPGVLPFLDADLPERPTRRRPAWLAMPVAQPHHLEPPSVDAYRRSKTQRRAGHRHRSFSLTVR